MTTASQRTLPVLEQIVKVVPDKTNLALLQLMWTVITGAFLSSRGAVHSALVWSGFEPGDIRRSWRALRWVNGVSKNYSSVFDNRWGKQDSGKVMNTEVTAR